MDSMESFFSGGVDCAMAAEASAYQIINRQIGDTRTGRFTSSSCGTEATLARQKSVHRVAVQFNKEASQTRDNWVAKNAPLRAARPDPSLRKERLLWMTIKVHQYCKSCAANGAERTARM